ncbi:MAG TPA: transaldolase family protein, partial [Armatimonadota bacterium]|nr:transaldolase family protein [Armatimonadota bacterium]
ELHPDFAEDAPATVAWAQRYFTLCPEKFIIKVPLTPAGFVAVRRIAGLGIPVNYTLGFSARQNVLATLFSRPAFVNVFLGRLNAVVKDNGLGDGANVGEKACLASDAWVKRLRSEDGGPPTRQIAASMRGPDQVVTLAGVDVHTIPPKVFRGFVELGAAATIAPYSAVDLPVQADLDLSVLWGVPDAFVDFARRAHAEGGTIASGADLVRLAVESGFGDLFHTWTDDERAEVRADGKIPVLSKWAGRVAIDDLMTRAALESFRVDQAALDDRLRGLL